VLVTYHVFHEDNTHNTETFFSEELAQCYIEAQPNKDEFDFYELEEDILL